MGRLSLDVVRSPTHDLREILQTSRSPGRLARVAWNDIRGRQHIYTAVQDTELLYRSDLQGIFIFGHADATQGKIVASDGVISTCLVINYGGQGQNRTANTGIFSRDGSFPTTSHAVTYGACAYNNAPRQTGVIFDDRVTRHNIGMLLSTAICSFRLATLAPLCRCHNRPVLTVRGR